MVMAELLSVWRRGDGQEGRARELCARCSLNTCCVLGTGMFFRMSRMLTA